MNLRVPPIALLCIGVISSCSVLQTGGQQNEIIVGEVGGESVTFSELQSNFYRSAGAHVSADEEDGLTGFLDLYLDYKAKLAVARDAGYYQNNEILEELQEYERQTAYPFWLEKRVRDELLDEFTERSEEAIHASHILISLSGQASPADTLDAYNRLMDARERFHAGESFDELSQEISTRQRGQSMGGDLGYFSAGWSVKEFEDAAYETPVDSVSMPFRSQFGYHLVYVQDRKPKPTERSMSHIFFQTRGEGHGEEAALEEAGEVFEKLEQGEDWNQLVTEYTHDRESRDTGGDIGWVGIGRYNQDFTDAVMSMEDPGTWSEPFYSGYGVHILRLDSIKSLADPEALRAESYERLQQLPRYRENREAVIHAVRKAGNERIYRENLISFEEYLEANDNPGINEIEWPEELKEKTLYRINDQTYSLEDFITWLGEHKSGRYRHFVLEEFVNDMADHQVIELTRSEFPEFKELSESYIHGLVVFKVSEDSVWNYAQRDTASLQAMYQANQESYHYGERYQFVRLSAAADSDLANAVQAYKGGIEADSLGNHVNGLVMRRDIIHNLNDEPYDRLAGLADGEFSDYFDLGNRRAVLLLEEVKEPRRMSFEEAYNRLAAEYQPVREHEWLQSIRERYSVAAWPEKLSEAGEN